MPGQQEETQNQYITPVNVTCAVICVVVYIVLEIMGDTNSASFMAQHGGLYAPAVILGGQWYRLLTAAFIHFGLPHLINNLILLICLGSYLERIYGHVRFAILYLVCAVGANGVSLAHMVRTDSMVVSGGASGVVFGMIGALGFFLISQKGHYRELPLRRFLVMLVLCLYFGFASGGLVDNAAHVGGLIIGFAVGAVYFVLGKMWQALRRGRRNESG